MIGPRHIYAVLAALALQGGAVAAALGDDQLDIEYAEIQPLAAESVLMDVTRIGDRLVAVGERGHVVWSDDGVQWQQAETVPTRSTLTAVVAVGQRLWAGGHDTVIITSGDHGRTWSRQFFDPERQQAVMDLHFTDEQNGVATGSYGLYLVTDDGGRSWQEDAVDEENQYHLNAAVRLPDGVHLIAGEAGYSYRSLDDGVTWEPLDLPYQGSMWGALISSRGCAVLYGLRGHVLQSCDSGDNWVELASGTQASLSGAAEHQGMLVFVGNSGVVLTWSGGGFTTHHLSSGVDLAAALPLSGGLFLLVGEGGWHLFPETGATPQQGGR
jgi:photosystem II stability/assembly factor-like uncharacterized protein